MPSFSERMGIVASRALQVSNLDALSRVALWNLVHDYIFAECIQGFPLDEETQSTVNHLWTTVLRLPIHLAPKTRDEVEKTFYRRFADSPWHVGMDLVEACGQGDARFRKASNRTFEAEAIAFRFVGEAIAPLTNEHEIAEVETALSARGDALAGARAHIEDALKKLGQRPQPDVRNSIKESISAVEAIARVIAGEGNTLGAALKRLDDDMDRALHGGLEKIYGWTCNEDGIRHAMMDEPSVAVEEARFMLVACSAFVNYLVVKADKKGIKL